MSPKEESKNDYVEDSGNHKIDVQINIKKFGEQVHNGLLNTKEMAHAWNWHSDCDELNWRGKPCTLRTSYDKKKETLKIQVWNELLQIWIYLNLSKSDIERIIKGEE